MVPIVDSVRRENLLPSSRRVLQATPEQFKDFWPQVKDVYPFFQQRRSFLDFLNLQGGKVLYLEGDYRPRPPFIILGDWRDRKDTATIWHIDAHGAQKERLVREAARSCFEEGKESVVTKLMEKAEAAEFRSWGFEDYCRVILLEKRLDGMDLLPAAREPAITRFRRRDAQEVLNLDAAAFDDFWRLDARTMDAVASSCPQNLFLLARVEGKVAGYTIGGISGRLAYLQRLGVEPSMQGRGIGRALASYLLRHMRGMGATIAIVNTQEDNLPAIALYHSLGFLDMPDSRFILRITRDRLRRGRG